jgi:hypothetical protein
LRAAFFAKIGGSASVQGGRAVVEQRLAPIGTASAAKVE